MPIGNPKYIPQYDSIAEKMCADGATDKKLAHYFGIDIKTLQRWKRKYETFRHSVYKGKDEWDGVKVENALLKRALGYRYDENTKELVAPIDNGDPKLVIVKSVRKEVAPDVNAIRWWLNNRRKTRWQDTSQLRLSGPGDGPIEIDHTFENIEEELKKRGVPIPNIGGADIDESK